MTSSEKKELEALLDKLTGTLHSRTHRTINTLAVFLAEIDLAIDKAREALDKIIPLEPPS